MILLVESVSFYLFNRQNYDFLYKFTNKAPEKKSGAVSDFYDCRNCRLFQCRNGFVEQSINKVVF